MIGRVLIVDDDANMRETVADNLEIAGYEIGQAASAAEAVALVRQKFFDVIIMDYNLGDGTGIDAIKQIRAMNSESQILMMTAHASLDMAVKAIQESVADFLAKPVDFDKLKHSIGRALERLRLQQENRRLIEDLKRVNEQLSKLNQMKSKFLSMASHDLSNSLMTLQVSFEMLLGSLQLNEDQKKKVNYIASGISQIARLIEDLVDWASIEQGKLRLEQRLFAPSPMIEELLTGARARAQVKGIEISAAVEPGLPDVYADKRRLFQVLNNMIENAIRHTPKGGRIQISLNRRKGGGEEVQWAVKDSGEGIAREELAKIFTSFYQGKDHRTAGRLGLGLSIAKEIIEAHKGRLWVESEGLGKGATFLFTVPVPARLESVSAAHEQKK